MWPRAGRIRHNRRSATEHNGRPKFGRDSRREVPYGASPLMADGEGERAPGRAVGGWKRVCGGIDGRRGCVRDDGGSIWEKMFQQRMRTWKTGGGLEGLLHVSGFLGACTGCTASASSHDLHNTEGGYRGIQGMAALQGAPASPSRRGGEEWTHAIGAWRGHDSLPPCKMLPGQPRHPLKISLISALLPASSCAVGTLR